nr:MAG TPA: hypothetical protein [Caudoviricetes sp.]
MPLSFKNSPHLFKLSFVQNLYQSKFGLVSSTVTI